MKPSEIKRIRGKLKQQSFCDELNKISRSILPDASIITIKSLRSWETDNKVNKRTPAEWSRFIILQYRASLEAKFINENISFGSGKINLSFKGFKFIPTTMLLSNDTEYRKTFTFKNLTKNDLENIKEIITEIQFMYNEIKRLRKENKELQCCSNCYNNDIHPRCNQECSIWLGFPFPNNWKQRIKK